MLDAYSWPNRKKGKLEKQKKKQRFVITMRCSHAAAIDVCFEGCLNYARRKKKARLGEIENREKVAKFTSITSLPIITWTKTSS